MRFSPLQVDMFHAFKPVIEIEAPEKGKSQWKSRLVAGIVMAGTFYLLYSHTPDVDLLKEEALRAHESLLDYLVRPLRLYRMLKNTLR